MAKLYFDTMLYTEEALRLLVKAVGVDHCLFGTKCPGLGSAVDPKSGRSMDDVKTLIDKLDFLAAEDKQNIFEDNARKVFRLSAKKATRFRCANRRYDPDSVRIDASFAQATSSVLAVTANVNVPIVPAPILGRWPMLFGLIGTVVFVRLRRI